MITSIKKGDAPKTHAAIEKAKVRYMNARGWPEHWRSEAINRAVVVGTSEPLYQQAMAALSDFRAQLVETLKINAFNGQLAAYRKASTRLARYPLAEGRKARFEQQPTGEFDLETGEPITKRVQVVSKIEPLPAEIEQPTYDDEGVQTGTETVPNPAIVKDEAERAAAQSVVDSTPQDVKDWTE